MVLADPGHAEVVAFETADPAVWVAEAITRREGGELVTMTELVPPSGAPRSLGLIAADKATVVQRGKVLEGTDAFAVTLEAAGGSPDGKPHGAQSADHHVGDMPNLKADVNGVALYLKMPAAKAPAAKTPAAKAPAAKAAATKAPAAKAPVKSEAEEAAEAAREGLDAEGVVDVPQRELTGGQRDDGARRHVHHPADAVDALAGERDRAADRHDRQCRVERRRRAHDPGGKTPQPHGRVAS